MHRIAKNKENMKRTKEEIIESLCKIKAEESNTIDLNAYAIGLTDMYDKELSHLQAKYDEECLLRHMDQVALGHKQEDYDLSVENYDKLMVSYEALQAKYDNLKKTFQELVFVHSPRNKQTRIGWYIKAWLENQD